MHRTFTVWALNLSVVFRSLSQELVTRYNGEISLGIQLLRHSNLNNQCFWVPKKKKKKVKTNLVCSGTVLWFFSVSGPESGVSHSLLYFRSPCDTLTRDDERWREGSDVGPPTETGRSSLRGFSGRVSWDPYTGKTWIVRLDTTDQREREGVIRHS